MSGIPKGWEVVIGLETHTQLSTAAKIFSGSPTTYGAEPNTQANAIDLALPGTLPVLNKGAVECAIKFGLAVHANIAARSIFARKNYFYPDLPKGYQISQYELPVVVGGKVNIHVGGVEKTVQLTRAHLEEDAGKSIHGYVAESDVKDGYVEGPDYDKTGIDLNRAGTPLLEIVTDPCMHSAEEAVAYAKVLHGIVTWIGICDGNMQEGSFRCDANVSVRRQGDPELGTRCEVKNVNSFRFLEKAIQYEIRRQIELIEDGGRVVQETRLYDADRDETRSMRSKEDAMDYRYFPDPDLLPLEISREWIEEIRKQMGETPDGAFLRMISDCSAANVARDAKGSTEPRRDIEIGWEQVTYGLPRADAEQLVRSKALTGYFESVVRAVGNPVHGRLVANWVLGELSALLNERGITCEESPVKAPQLAFLIRRIADATISGKTAKEVFHMIARGDVEGDHPDNAADILIERNGLRQVSDSGAIERMVDDVIAANPKSVEEYKAGKEKALNALFGQVMKASNKTANPAQVTEFLKRKLQT